MTEFGRWLGKSNGETMLASVFKQWSCTAEQARAAVTTYCMLFGIEVDTREWDDLMRWINDNYNSWFDGIEELDNFMCGLLI